jgi:ATP-dependent DNA ligase
MSQQLREFRRGLADLKAASRIEPCLPPPARKPPSGAGWLYGFRMTTRRDVAGVRIITRNGHDWTHVSRS